MTTVTTMTREQADAALADARENYHKAQADLKALRKLVTAARKTTDKIAFAEFKAARKESRTAAAEVK